MLEGYRQFFLQMNDSVSDESSKLGERNKKFVDQKFERKKKEKEARMR